VYPDERLQQPENWNTRGVKSGERHPRERLNSIIQAITQAPTHKFNRLQAARGEEEEDVCVLRMKNEGRRPTKRR
jgi:hypothetical protein